MYPKFLDQFQFSAIEFTGPRAYANVINFRYATLEATTFSKAAAR